MSLTPGTRLGHYEILGPLGAGGMGEVYKARDPRIGRGRIVGAAQEITRLDLATGRREKWKELRPADMAGVAGYSWLLSTPDGRSFVYSYYRSLSDLYLVTGVR